MHSVEIESLSSPISNASRVLYFLGLRPTCDENTGLTAPINYKSLTEILQSGGFLVEKGRDINSLIEELVQVGLVAKDSKTQESLSGKQILLPLAKNNVCTSTHLYLSKSTIVKSWLPKQELLSEIADLVGLIETEYDPYQLGEFIAYWLGRPEVQLSEYQWTQKFVLFLRQTKTVLPIEHSKVHGYQKTKKQSEVELSDNAKQLVSKYSKRP